MSLSFLHLTINSITEILNHVTNKKEDTNLIYVEIHHYCGLGRLARRIWSSQPKAKLLGNI